VLSVVAACADAPSSPPTALAPTRSAAASLADAPARATSMPFLFFVTGGPPTYAAVTPTSPASTLLWDLRGKMPVIAPDGHQVMHGGYLTEHHLMTVGRDERHFPAQVRSEEHTSELQSRSDLVCRLALEIKNWTIRR